MIVEYAEHGNLRDFLRKHNAGSFNDGYERPNTERPVVSEKNLLSFARQVRKKHFFEFSFAKKKHFSNIAFLLTLNKEHKQPSLDLND